MSNLTMPTINLAFRQQASTAVARSQKGVVALILRDAALAGKNYTINSRKAIPDGIGMENKAAIERVFLGYVKPPKQILLYVIDDDETVTADCAALKWLATQKFDYLAGPADLSTDEAAVIKAWIISQRTENFAIYKAVLPNVTADNEAIVNFVGSGIDIGTGSTLSAAAYCGRIAGLLAGTPMNISATYAPLPEVYDITRMTAGEMDTAVGAGKLLLYHDGEKVKLGRAVNSLTTVAGKSDSWKKIKIIELQDMTQQDIRRTLQNNYIGKYANTYENKQLLVTAITDYLAALSKDGLIGKNYSCAIDVDAQDEYLQSQGVSTVNMSEDEIRQANTGTHVFLTVYMEPVDAIEDADVGIYLPISA